MALLALDIGTTHCKAAVFNPHGRLLGRADRPTTAQRGSGFQFYDPERLWQTVLEVAAAARRAARQPRTEAIGVAGMAETGLLLDRRTGAARSPLLPWWDTPATAKADLLGSAPVDETFARFGIYPSFKVSLAKLLWWREREPAAVQGAAWLSAPDYIVFRLTGAAATDYSLACRTFAFDLDRRAWAADWLHSFGLPDEMFAPVGPATRAVGVTGRGAGLPIEADVPVVVAGHDHLCAALAVGVSSGGPAFDSMGTAEALLGAMEPRRLGRPEQDTGLSFGILPDGESMYWLGGLSSSGGAVEWLRGVLGDPPLSYAEVGALAQLIEKRPGELLFLPYLSGAGAPRPDPELRGAFVGLGAGHGRADLLQAVLEGTALQMEAIRRAAAGVAGRPVDRIVAAGGGTRNRRWLEIKADVYGIPIEALALDDGTLLGAAMCAGIAGGVYRDLFDARNAVSQPVAVFPPDARRHASYRRQFAVFEAWQRMLATNGTRINEG